jgi:hypothetical protein
LQFSLARSHPVSGWPVLSETAGTEVRFDLRRRFEFDRNSKADGACLDGEDWSGRLRPSGDRFEPKDLGRFLRARGQGVTVSSRLRGALPVGGPVDATGAI